MAGENMIKALDTRFTKVRSTSAELDRVGAFYSRIIELCVSNPPKDNRHLRALEEQVHTTSHSILRSKKWKHVQKFSNGLPRNHFGQNCDQTTEIFTNI